MKRWVAVLLHVPKEYGEAVSNFLMEQGATGTETVDEDPIREKLKAYFPQDGKERRTLRALDRYLASLRKMDPKISPSLMETFSIAEQDWGENWKRFFKPVQVTRKFMVKPPWSRVRLKRGQMFIEISPGMAFGTGMHATTKLCLHALEARLKMKGLSVLDLGTGSGILSIGAARLGAKEVLGVDMDGVAVDIARENVRINGVSDIVKIRKGRIGDVRGRFDVVVANIDLRSLRRMRGAFSKHLRNRGYLILSGILEKEKETFIQTYLEAGWFRFVNVIQEEEWVCFTFKKIH